MDFEFNGKKYTKIQISRLNEIADNSTEFVKYYTAAEDRDERNRRVNLINAFKKARGDDLDRTSSSALIGLIDTGGFGFGLEAAAGVSAAVDAVKGESSFGDAYQGYLKRAEDERDRFQEKYPGQALTTDVAGGLLTGGAALKGAKYLNPFKGKNLFTRGANLAAEGALAGGLYGAGYDSDDRLGGLLSGGSIGAFANPILVGGGIGLARVAEPLVESVGRGTANISNMAKDKIINPIRKYFGAKENVAPTTVMEDAKVREALGNTVEIGGGRGDVVNKIDQGVPLAGNQDVIREAKPVLNQTVGWNNFKDEVLQNRSTAITKAYDDIIDDLGNLQDVPRKTDELFIDYIKRVSKDNSKAASKAYDDLALDKKIVDNVDFKDNFINYIGRDIFSELSDSTKRSIQGINGKVGADGIVRKLFKVTDDGITLRDGVTIDDISTLNVENIYRALRNANRNAYKIGGDSVDGDIIRGNNLLNDIDDIIKKGTDDIGDVRAKYKKNIEINEASDDGYKLWNNKKPEGFLSELRRLKDLDDPAQYSGFVRGAMRKISEELKGNSKQNFIRKLSIDDANESLMFRELFPDDSIDDVLSTINKTNDFIGAAQEIGKYTSSQSIGRANKGLLDDNLTTEGFIRKAARNLLPPDMNEAQKKRFMDLLLTTVPKNITDNLDLPGYPEMLNEFIRRNIGSQQAILTNRPQT